MAEINKTMVLLLLVGLVLLVNPAHAFGAGNIASVSAIEGQNWRHGDIEDVLASIAFIRGHKWNSMTIKRTYFGNWLRDYSQAVDVGTLKGVQAETIRVLVWVLAFMSFGYATAEFEVTADRLGVYRPEEHIDNPKDYAENVDARQYDSRLRGPVMQEELAVDPNTGMKNYIANDNGRWATSVGYIRYSFARSMHFGRLYTHGAQKGREEDLCEALRCLGQGLHCMEDFGAHTNYTELALREMGHLNVFPHTGTNTMINLRGKQVFPLVTGTFGGVDFLHSVLGEASDHVTQSEANQAEVDQLNSALNNAASVAQGHGTRSFGDPATKASGFTDLLAQIPGTDGLVSEAINLQAASDAQAAENERLASGGYNNYGADNSMYYSTRATDAGAPRFDAPPGSQGGPPGPGIPGTNINVDPQQAIAKIYPLLAFRDKVVRTIAGFVSKIPGLEKLIETVSEKVTLFVMGLLAPYVKPIIAAASNGLKVGSGSVVSASAQQQYLPWTDPNCTDPTHSMLSKDHFSNILNGPAGQVAAEILRYVAPRVIYGWEHPEVPEHEILDDISRVFHHPAIRDQNNEAHRRMFGVVEKWVQNRPDRGRELNDILSAESVRAGRNHTVKNFGQSVQGLEQQLQGLGTTSHSVTAGGPMAMFSGGQRNMDFSSDGRGDESYQSHNRDERNPDYAQASYSQGPPQPAGFSQGDSSAYPTAYEQGYDAPSAFGQGASSEYERYGGQASRDEQYYQNRPGGY